MTRRLEWNKQLISRRESPARCSAALLTRAQRLWRRARRNPKADAPVVEIEHTEPLRPAIPEELEPGLALARELKQRLEWQKLAEAATRLCILHSTNSEAHALFLESQAALGAPGCLHRYRAIDFAGATFVPLKQVKSPVVGEHLRRLFDPEYYLAQLRERHLPVEDALAHYFTVGWMLGCDPHPLFSSEYYFQQRSDVLRRGINPLVHYITTGHNSSVNPHPLFNERHYQSRLDPRPECFSAGPGLSHYLSEPNSSHSPHPFFDQSYYLRQLGTEHQRGVEPALLHYLRNHDAQGLAPHPAFHSDFYAADSSGVDYAAHALGFGLPPSLKESWDRLEPLVYLGLVNSEYRSALQRLHAPPKIRRHSVSWRALIAVPSAEPTENSRMLLQTVETLSQQFGIECFVFLLGGGALEPDFERVAKVVRGSDLTSHRCASSFAPMAAAIHKLGRTFALTDSRSCAGLERLFSDLNIPTFNVTHNGGSGLLNYIATTLKVSQIGRYKRPHSTIAQQPARPKVFVVTPHWSLSGVNVVMGRIVDGLRENGWDASFLVTRDENASTSEHRPASAPITVVEKFRHPVDRWERIRQILIEAGPCIALLCFDFHANALSSTLPDDIGLIGLIQSDSDEYYEMAYALGPYWNRLVAVSDLIAEKIGSMNPALAGKIVKITNSTVSTEEITPRKDRHGDPAAPLRLIYTGRLVHEQKRVLDFPDLLEALDRAGIPYTFTFAGGEELIDCSEKLKLRLADKIADGRVQLHGRVQPAEVKRLLAAHEVFVLISDFEGQPLALVEAMANGCVPVVTDIKSGIPELIDHGRNGFIVRERNWDELAQYLKTLAADRALLAEMGANAQETIRSRFSLEQVTACYSQMLDDVSRELRDGSYRRPAPIYMYSRLGDVAPISQLLAV